jgi:hypothetical protein
MAGTSPAMTENLEIQRAGWVFSLGSAPNSTPGRGLEIGAKIYVIPGRPKAEPGTQATGLCDRYGLRLLPVPWVPALQPARAGFRPG